MNILVFGGTGFVGTHVLKHLEDLDASISIAIRPKEENTTSFPAVTADITNTESVREAVKKIQPNIIIHLVGIIEEHPPHVTFEKIHVKGTQNIVSAAKEHGVEKMIYVSALGAEKNASTDYYRTKFQAQQFIQDSGIDFTILRPSLMFGDGAGFTNQIKELFELPLPFVPVIGSGDYPFKPVAVDVIASCIKQSCEGKASKEIIELVGPEEISLRELTVRLKKRLQSKKPLFSVPVFLLKIIASSKRLGLPAPISSDQLTMILEGNTSKSTKMEEAFDIKQISFDPEGDYPLY